MSRNTQHTGDKVKKSKIINQQYAEVALDALKPHPMNPRRGDVAEISKSIARNGFYGALVVQKSTGHILAGNHRYLAAKDQGMASLPVVWVDVDETEAQRILLADNRTSDLGDYDNEQLAALLDGLAQGDGLDGTGYEQSDLDKLLADLTPVEMEPAPASSADEIDVDGFEMGCTCPRCGFEFNND